VNVRDAAGCLAGELFELSNRRGDDNFLAIIGDPNRERSAPITITRNRPIVRFDKPVVEPPFLDVFRDPVGRLRRERKKGRRDGACAWRERWNGGARGKEGRKGERREQQCMCDEREINREREKREREREGWGVVCPCTVVETVRS
jgi:hypothetical protein